jgi:hypothetical protein
VPMVVASLRAIARDDGCGDRHQSENANTHQARGGQVFAKHEIPVPVFDLITRS